MTEPAGQVPAILWPTLALAGLIFCVWAILLRQRLRHVATNPPTRANFVTRAASDLYFAPVERAANNLANLFEMPVLYFALVPLLLARGGVDPVEVALAWAFVALRLVHSAIHIGRNTIRHRYRAYLASTLVLLAMWIWYAVETVLPLLMGVPHGQV